MALNIFSRLGRTSGRGSVAGTSGGGAHTTSGLKTGNPSPGERNGRLKRFNPTKLGGTELTRTSYQGGRISFCESSNSIEVAGLTAEATVEYGEYSAIDKITLVFNMPRTTYTEQDKQDIIRRVKDCPVSRSLREDLQKEYIFNWPS